MIAANHAVISTTPCITTPVALGTQFNTIGVDPANALIPCGSANLENGVYHVSQNW